MSAQGGVVTLWVGNFGMEVCHIFTMRVQSGVPLRRAISPQLLTEEQDVSSILCLAAAVWFVSCEVPQSSHSLLQGSQQSLAMGSPSCSTFYFIPPQHFLQAAVGVAWEIIMELIPCLPTAFPPWNSNCILPWNFLLFQPLSECDYNFSLKIFPQMSLIFPHFPT